MGIMLAPGAVGVAARLMTEFHVALFAVGDSQLVEQHGGEGFGPLQWTHFSDGLKFFC